MPEEPPSGRVPYRLDTETVERIGWTLAAVFFLIAIVSAIGEFAGWAEPISRAAEHVGLGQIAGWWNDVGEVGMTVGTLGGLFLTFTTLIRGADSSEVRAVHEAVESTGETLSSIDAKADLQIEKLDKLDDLDRVQLELDRQTGVLRDIRDLL